MIDFLDLFSLPFMQRALIAALLHRPGRPRRRHLPRAAPTGADGRRHRPRRRDRCRARPADRRLPHLDGRGRRRSRRGADRGDPRAWSHQRRRRARPAVLRRPRRRRAASPASPGRAPPASRSTSSARSRASPRATCGSPIGARCRASWSSRVGLLPQLFAVARTRSSPAWPGCDVRAYNLLIAVLAAVTVTVAMRTVGLLLVSALMVVPVATSQQLARSFRTTLVGAMLVGAVAAVGGLLLARGAVLPGHRGTRPDDRAARAGEVRVHVADRRVAAAPAPAARALPGRRGRGARDHRRAPARARRGLRPPRPCRTVTTSTTCTTATGTPRTESTMTSTDRPAGSRPTRQRRAVADALATFDDFRSAQEIHDLLGAAGRLGRTGHGLPDPAAARRGRRGRHAAHRGRRGDLPPLLRHPPPPPGVPHAAARPSRSRVRRSSAGRARSPREHGFADVSHTLEIFGTCPTCR